MDETMTEEEVQTDISAEPEVSGDLSSEETPPEISEKTIPIERFNQVYGNYKAYKEFGKPDEIRAKLQKLETYERTIAEHRQKASQGADDPKAEILKQAQEVGIATKADIDGRFQRIIANNLNNASRHLKAVLDTNKVELTADLQDEIEEYLWQRMDQNERDAVMYGDFSVIDSIVGKTIETGLLSKWKAAPPSTPPAPPKRHSTGGTPPKAPAAGPKTWKDADDEGWSMINGGK